MNGSMVTAAIGLLTVVATVITAVPGFKQLAADRAYVYYDVSELSILNPNSPDLPRVRMVLRDNNISDSTVAIRMKNTGQGPAKEVRLGVLVSGEIEDNVEFVPALNEKPVWVDPPAAASIGTNRATATAEFHNFAQERILKVTIRYHSGQQTRPVTVDVYFDGKPAQKVADVTSAPPHTALSEFARPLKILIGGIVLMMVAAVVITFARAKELLRGILPWPLNLL